MSITARIFLALALLFFSFTAAGAASAPFSHQGVSADAKRYADYLRSSWQPPKGAKPDELRLAGNKVFAGDPRAASRSFAHAAVLDDKDTEAWIRLAESLLAIKPDPDKGSERYDLPVNASGAAYRAYERAQSNEQKARALAVLGSALQRRSYWRPAIDALKTSLDIANNQGVRESYDKLRAEHGFRMTDYKTESESSSPRLCLQFSENLSRAQVDFAKFVSVDGKDPQAVLVESQQLCIDGLAHGQRYEVQIKAGLPSDAGENLGKTADLGIYVPDRKPLVRFTGKSYVLPSRGQQGIPVVTINTSKIDVEVYRVGDRSIAGTIENGDMQRQLYQYDVDQIRDKTGTKVYSGSMETTSKLNEEVTTAIPVTDATGALQPGAYVVIARPTEKMRGDEGQVATQWFIVSDLGLSAFTGEDGIHAFVRSLADATALENADVKIVAKNNEVLGTAKTDARGYAHFQASLVKGEGGNVPAVLVAQKGDGEYAFLDLSASAFDLSDRGVKGRETPGPIDGFVYTERGVYRAGETVNISALVRERSGKAATLPTTVIIARPDGVEHSRIVLDDKGLGGRQAELKLAKTAMTGTWRLWLHTDPKAPFIAERAFLVEDFVPERLDMTLATASKALQPDEPSTIDATGRYLYGPPAANLAIEGEIVVKASNRDVDGFDGYQFGQSTDFVNPVRQAIEGTPKTDAEGKAAVKVSLPAVPRTARPLEAQLIMKLREDGGRTIERTLTLPVDMRQPRIGIKPAFEAQGVSENETANFDVVLLDANGKRVASDKLRWELTRLDSNWQWYRRDGQWSYESVTISRKAGGGDFASLADAPAKISAKVDYGRYRLDVTSTDRDGPASSIAFNAGWFAAQDAPDSPELLDVALDKESYKPGEKAKLRIASKHGGKALIAVLGETLQEIKEADIPKGGGDVEIDVKDTWGPGAYATALLYRPMDQQAKRMPARSVGIRWLAVDQSARELKVVMTPVAKVKSASTLTVPVKVEGLTPGEDARVVLAAVDVGILNLTRYEVPKPEGWFNAQRKLGFEIRDFYGRLIDGMRADAGKLRSGGDGGVAMQGNPTVETVVSLVSDIVTVGQDGTASIDFDMPDFNGTVRVMAVAWSADKVGHGSVDVIVRDALAVTASAPRFLTLGDEAKLDFDIHNVEGPAAGYTLSVAEKAAPEATTSVSLVERTVDLKDGEHRHETLAFKPKDIGQVTLALRITGPNDIAIKREMTFEVFPPAGDIKRTTITTLAAKGGKLKLTADIIADLIPSRTKVNVSAGPGARLDVPALLTQLDRYPYGCAEQTVSRALPLLYANSVATGSGITTDKALKERVQAAVNRVFEMQDSSGAFGVWGPSDGDLWLTAYVTDFLSRAKEGGYDVPALGFAQALDRLKNFIAYAEDFEKGGEDRAYALYVLARNSRAPIGELRYYADTRLDRFSTALAKAQLGAALAMMGDKERAERTFSAALATFSTDQVSTGYRADYGSRIRDGAALVTLASETGLSKSETPKLVEVIAKAYQARSYTSTQEQAWMLLAANALSDEAKQTELSVNGVATKGALLRSLTPAELKNGELVITNDGDAGVDAVVSIIGAALTPEPPASKGFKIERAAYTLDGKKVELASLTGGKAQVKQNDRFVMTVTVTSDDASGRVMLVDRLPAGFEIENPRLVESGAISGLSWVTPTVTPEHTEFRDDRFVAAFNLSGKSSNDTQSSGDGAQAETGEAVPAEAPAATATIAYIVRAVTPGTFVHPAATVEDMYRPERYARSSAGTLVVGQ